MVQMQKPSSVVGTKASEDDTMKLVSLVMSTVLTFAKSGKNIKKNRFACKKIKLNYNDKTNKQTNQPTNLEARSGSDGYNEDPKQS